MHKRLSLMNAAPGDNEAMISRAIKNLTPLSLRIFLKSRLHARLVSAVATPPAPAAARRKANDAGKPIQPECPICGTSLSNATYPLDVQCSGCGALPHHRKLALAVYAYAKQADTQVLAVGSDDVLRFMCEGFEKVSFAEDLADVPAELRSRVDLCIHSHWLQDSKMGPEKSLLSLDALLSSNGKQIFTIDASRRWHSVQWQRGQQALLEWLRRKGVAEVNMFEPDEVYGIGANEIFGCNTKAGSSAIVIYLPKATPV